MHTAAESVQPLTSLMNLQEWQEQNLLTPGVALLKEHGVPRGPSQVFEFAPNQHSPEKLTGPL